MASANHNKASLKTDGNSPQLGDGVSCSIEDLIFLRLQAAKLSAYSKRKSKETMASGHVSSLRGRGLDFEGVRIYQPGDEVRSIDWRVTAKTGKTHTRTYTEEKERAIFIVLDQRKTMSFGSKLYFKSVIAAHISALFAWAAIKQGDRVGGLVFSDSSHQEIKPKSGKKGVLNFLNVAAEFNQRLTQGIKNSDPEKNASSDKESLSSIIFKLNQIIRPGSMIILISDFHDLDSEADQQLTQLARHNDILPYFIVDPLEKQLPDSGIYAFTNLDTDLDENRGANANITEVQTSSRQLHKNYHDRFETKKQQIAAIFMQHGIGLSEISTEHAAADQLGA